MDVPKVQDKMTPFPARDIELRLDLVMVGVFHLHRKLPCIFVGGEEVHLVQADLRILLTLRIEAHEADEAIRRSQKPRSVRTHKHPALIALPTHLVLLLPELHGTGLISDPKLDGLTISLLLPLLCSVTLPDVPHLVVALCGTKLKLFHFCEG